MSYNENEIVKLKHLNEFAAQLNAKIDGDTYPKLDRSINATIGGSAYDGSLARVPLSTIPNSNVFRNNSFQFPSKVPICPRVIDFTVTEGDNTVTNTAGGWYTTQPDTWTACRFALGARVPCKFNFRVVVPADDIYKQINQIFYVEVYDDSQEV